MLDLLDAWASVVLVHVAGQIFAVSQVTSEVHMYEVQLTYNHVGG